MDKELAKELATWRATSTMPRRDDPCICNRPAQLAEWKKRLNA